MTTEEIIQKMIDKFHRRMDKDEKARAEVEPIVKRFNVDLGEETYHMRLEHAKVTDFDKGLYDEADITLKTTPEHLRQLIEGTLRPMRAYVTKKITVKGKIEDILHLKKFF
ncbi:MAG: SCP2 sterol-binding domain-containing protein [Candidatus Methanomethylophilaceae archaeon]|nr:SCP2 sterol-binding domain-containing protein [Candidatus Methanomethylophilaceae archaeon]MBQ6547418.1 SCP2 sterol-binding domain-containing protein [Candidatus Methanomethylophilaceae archaeon]